MGLKEVLNLKHTMKTMNAESEIELKSWKQDLYQRTKDGDSHASLKKRNKFNKRLNMTLKALALS